MGYNWDGDDYARSSSGQQKWARELIAKLNLRGRERVLDVGCGDGKVTAEIADLVPGSLVVGLDFSAEMIAFARKAFPVEQHPTMRFVRADAARLCFKEAFDVVFSNATLHWVRDHRAVLAGIAQSLRPGGKTLLQMGGRGNAALVVEVMEKVIARPAWKSYFKGFQFPYSFYGPESYVDWLDGAGLEGLRVELIPKDMTHKGREGFRAWFRTTWHPYIQSVPVEAREGFIDGFVEAYCAEESEDGEGLVHVKMVRLEVEAVKRG